MKNEYRENLANLRTFARRLAQAGLAEGTTAELWRDASEQEECVINKGFALVTFDFCCFSEEGARSTSRNARVTLVAGRMPNAEYWLLQRARLERSVNGAKGPIQSEWTLTLELEGDNLRAYEIKAIPVPFRALEGVIVANKGKEGKAPRVECITADFARTRQDQFARSFSDVNSYVEAQKAVIRFCEG